MQADSVEDPAVEIPVDSMWVAQEAAPGREPRAEARKSTFDQTTCLEVHRAAYIVLVTARCSGSAMRARLAALGIRSGRDH